MRLTEELASRIVERLRSILQIELALADQTGVVQASTETVQVGLRHALSEQIKENNEPVFIGRAEMGELGLSTPTVLLPLWHEGKVLGVFVLAGSRREFPQARLKLVQGLSEVVMFQHELASSLESKEEAQARFIWKLLTDESVKELEEVYPEADVLRINLRKRYAICYIQIHQLKEIYLEQTRGRRRTASFQRFVTTIKDQVASSLGERSTQVIFSDPSTFIVLYDIEDQRIPRRPTLFYKKFVRKIYDTLKESVPGHVTIGIGGYYQGLEGLRKSYREAKLACEVGAKIRGRDSIYHIYDVGMFVAMTNISSDDKLALAEQILEPLLENTELLRTIKTFLDLGMNLTEAAAALHIHRNTLIYRLDKIEEMIALDPRKFDDALQIKLGLMIYQTAQLV
jgi:carbohydrate diacid regulator